MKRIWIGQSAAKLRIGEGSTTTPTAAVGASAPKRGTLNRKRHGEDIVYTLLKSRGHENVGQGVASLNYANVATEHGAQPEDFSGNSHNIPNVMDLTGEYEDRHFVVTRGDSRISVELARNKETVRLDRSNRFLIDDEDSPHPLAYLLTKPLKLGAYQGKGCFKFVLQEVTETDDDNVEERTADYYKHFPKVEPIDPKPDVNGKKVWL